MAGEEILSCDEARLIDLCSATDKKICKVLSSNSEVNIQINFFEIRSIVFLKILHQKVFCLDNDSRNFQSALTAGIKKFFISQGVRHDLS